MGAKVSAAMFLSLAASALWSQKPIRVASVEVRTFDTHGRALKSPRISLFESEDGLNRAAQFADNRASGIPFGLYRVRVYAEGFSSDYRYVRVSSPITLVVVGLAIGGVSQQVSEPVLSGLVRGAVLSRSMFVRAVGVFSGIQAECAVGVNGTFALTGVPEGDYVIFAADERGVLAMRLVRFSGGMADATLDIDAPQIRDRWR